MAIHPENVQLPVADPPRASKGRMRVVLISPKGPLYRHRGGIFKRSLRYAPLTLPTLAALIPPELEIELTLVDEGIEEVDPSLEADLVGMTVITGSASRAYELSAGFRARGIPVVLGGPHVTLVPDDAAPHADSLVVGYAEETWPRLLRDHAAGRMKPRYVQDPALDLAGRPFARRDLIPRGRYLTSNVFEATRGCVHNCEFCVVPAAWGRRPLQRPVEEVVAEIRQTKARKLIFIDLNLVADRAYARELFTALIPLKVRWFGLSTTLLAKDEALLELAAESGCSGLLVGFESIHDDRLRGIDKGFNRPDDYARIVTALHERGITIMGTFVFGLDGDTPAVFEETARWVIEHGIDLPRYAVLTPFPGTALYRRLDAEGRILTKDWSLYDGQHVVYQPDGMTVDELDAGHQTAWRQTYTASAIARRLAKSRLQLGRSLMANLGYRFYARHLRTYYNCDWFVGSTPGVPPVTGGTG